MSSNPSGLLVEQLDRVFFAPTHSPNMPIDIDEDDYVNSNYSEDDEKDVDLSAESEMDASDTENENENEEDIGSNTENDDEDDCWEVKQIDSSSTTKSSKLPAFPKKKNLKKSKSVVSDSSESEDEDEDVEVSKPVGKPIQEIQSSSIIKPQSLVTIVNGKPGTKNQQAFVRALPYLSCNPSHLSLLTLSFSTFSGALLPWTQKHGAKVHGSCGRKQNQEIH